VAGVRRILALLPLAACLGEGRAQAQAPGPPERPPSFLSVSAGAFDANKRRDPAFELGVQWRGAGRLWRLHPIVGAMATTDRGLNAYGGFCLDVPAGRRAVLKGSFAPGLYAKGRGKELGRTVEFRSALEVGWRFGNGARLGIELYHLSNASFSRTNPGEESLVLVLSLPRGRR
jgi:hypothetical protein